MASHFGLSWKHLVWLGGNRSGGNGGDLGDGDNNDEECAYRSFSRQQAPREPLRILRQSVSTALRNGSLELGHTGAKHLGNMTAMRNLYNGLFGFKSRCQCRPPTFLLQRATASQPADGLELDDAKGTWRFGGRQRTNAKLEPHRAAYHGEWPIMFRRGLRLGGTLAMYFLFVILNFNTTPFLATSHSTLYQSTTHKYSPS